MPFSLILCLTIRRIPGGMDWEAEKDFEIIRPFLTRLRNFTYRV